MCKYIELLTYGIYVEESLLQSYRKSRNICLRYHDLIFTIYYQTFIKKILLWIKFKTRTVMYIIWDVFCTISLVLQQIHTSTPMDPTHITYAIILSRDSFTITLSQDWLIFENCCGSFVNTIITGKLRRKKSPWISVKKKRLNSIISLQIRRRLFSQVVDWSRHLGSQNTATFVLFGFLFLSTWN